MDSFILKKIVTAVNSTTTLVEPGDVDQPFQLGSIWLSLLVLIPILFLPFFFFCSLFCVMACNKFDGGRGDRRRPTSRQRADESTSTGDVLHATSAV